MTLTPEEKQQPQNPVEETQKQPTDGSGESSDVEIDARLALDVSEIDVGELNDDEIGGDEIAGDELEGDGSDEASSSLHHRPTPNVRISVNILLPDSVDRRFERWAEKMPGASWPDWGGHITLIPAFVPAVPPDEVFQRLATITEALAPFRLRLAEPTAIDDATRPGYQAVFLMVDQVRDIDHNRLYAAYTAINAAISDIVQDSHTALADQPFLPHVTLALGIGELEAANMVKEMKADPISAKFLVDELSLVISTRDEQHHHIEKRVLPLGPPNPVGLLSD